MNFFNQISELIPEGVDLNITIRKKAEQLTVSIFPKANGLKDEAQNRLSPLVITGSADELNEGFFTAIENPVKKSTGLLTNMLEFEKSAKEAEANSKAEKERKEKEKKEAEERKKKLGKLTLKADELEAKKDFRGAIKTLTEALELSSDTTKIQNRISDLKVKLSQNSLFDQVAPEVEKEVEFNEEEE